MFFEKRKIQEDKKENTILLVQFKKTTITVRKKKKEGEIQEKTIMTKIKGKEMENAN